MVTDHGMQSESHLSNTTVQRELAPSQESPSLVVAPAS